MGNEEINNIGTFLRIVDSLKQDGALEKEDWELLLPLMIQLCQKLRIAFDHKVVLSIMLAGTEKVLEEVAEHIEEL